MIECAGTCHLHPQRLPLPIFHLLYCLIFSFHARKSSREQIIGFPPLKYSATRVRRSSPLSSPRYLLPARPGGLNPPRDPWKKADLGAACGRRGLTDPDATLSSSTLSRRLSPHFRLVKMPALSQEESRVSLGDFTAAGCD